MARLVGLNAATWDDESLGGVVQKAADWGYAALELACGGRHFDVSMLSEDAAQVKQLEEALSQHELHLASLGVHGLGQVQTDMLDAGHQSIVPKSVWGDGRPEGVRERAAAHLRQAASLAHQLGVQTLVGFTGFPCSQASDYPPRSADLRNEHWRSFARAWEPILEGFATTGVRFAQQLHPGQAAFDLYSAEATLDALGGREEFGFALDPATLHWQGLDPVEFVRRFPERIFQVRIRDVAVTLNGRTGLLCGRLPDCDARRGWEHRSPGRGGVAWESLFRALERAGYLGPYVVDWRDPDLDRDQGAAEALQFVRRLDGFAAAD